MNSFLIAILLIIVCCLILCYPILISSGNNSIFFSSGMNKVADLNLKRQSILANIYDLQIEKEMGKMGNREFEYMALPLAAEIETIQKKLTESSDEKGSSNRYRPNRLGIFCPLCGKLNHNRKKSPPQFCEQCGDDF